eukprot:CAMPEP_0181205158 /NCGR_PEP_ID=MMETSP1096-20121128/20318_1 /TAXON_ID=156174 ORGANISM="Chrysochromulina ericina, Strain CCMP281" /NCGR_SAMPLE_ID=MMETSP1096 /ASSEMBLY_ACC=CAM_ASM_000453 /LENGTH=139 /DNA_ID=CAMNT_0023295903 /DNA_START=591 /DNA_END=1010 /DNA_ORIENTATION=+
MQHKQDKDWDATRLPTHACVQIPVPTGGREGRASGARSACQCPVRAGCAGDRGGQREPMLLPNKRMGRYRPLPSPTRACGFDGHRTGHPPRRPASPRAASHMDMAHQPVKGYTKGCPRSMCLCPPAVSESCVLKPGIPI